MTIHKIIVVLDEHEIGNVDRQVLVLDVSEVPPRQNPYHLAKTLKWRARKSSEEDGRLTAGTPVTADTLIKQTKPPFTRRTMRARGSSKFKLPTQFGIYEGKTDPMDHLDSYKSLMSL